MGEEIIGVQRQRVKLKKISKAIYDSQFLVEKERLMKLLEGYYIAIEHVGSTSIPGLLAKPIVDIAVGIKDFDSIDEIISLLEEEYIYLPDHGEEKRKIFIKKDGDLITHHIHIEEYGKQNWINHVDFRNKLLESEQLREEYVALKETLLAKYKDERTKYTSAKAEFIQKVIHE